MFNIDFFFSVGGGGGGGLVVNKFTCINSE
jgi:hypothetical protein